MTSRFGLTEVDIQKICSVFSHYPEIKKVILYGSRAKGNYKNGSDIDLVLFGEPPLSLEMLYQVTKELDDLLLPYSMDVSIFETLRNPDLIEHIRRVGIVFYESFSEGRKPHLK